MLEAGGLGQLVPAESLQAEEAGGISFVDGYFEVAGSVKEGQFLAFGHVGVGFADLVDDFIAAEEYLEAAVLALRIELVAGDIDHYVFEAVDMDDLAFDEVIAYQGLQVMFHLDLLREGGYFPERFASAQFTGSHGQQLDHGERGLGRIGGQRYFHHFLRHTSGDHGQQAVIGAADILAVMFRHQDVVRFPVEQIDQYKMERAERKPGESAFTDVSGLGEIERADMVGDVRNMTFRAVMPELPFDGTYQVILHPYV